VQPPEIPLLDEAVLAELLDSTGDDVEFVADLLHTYLAETPEQLAGISAAVDARDAGALVRPAHTLKSSSATLGAMRLSGIGRELEMMGRSEAVSAEASGLRDEAEQTWAQTQGALQAWLSGHGA
jgi:HPt (histidine-containing phosphotransfer) domain-containing protein